MLKITGQAFIVLNSAQAASDLFEKRSRKYSGRPYLPMVMEPNLYAVDLYKEILLTNDLCVESIGPVISGFFLTESAGNANAS